MNRRVKGLQHCDQPFHAFSIVVRFKCPINIKRRRLQTFAIRPRATMGCSLHFYLKSCRPVLACRQSKYSAPTRSSHLSQSRTLKTLTPNSRSECRGPCCRPQTFSFIVLLQAYNHGRMLTFYTPFLSAKNADALALLTETEMTTKCEVVELLD